MDQILVALRIYPGNTKIPSVIFPNDKYQLVYHSLKQLRHALRHYNYKIILINDGFSDNLVASVIDFDTSDILDIIHTGGIGNHATFDLQIDQLLAYDEYQYLYFAEDDYLYTGNFVSDNLKMLNKFDYTTGYYHPDYVNLEFHSKRRGVDDKQYNTTTCSFWTTRSILLADRKRLKTYRLIGDIGFWIILTCSFWTIIDKLINLQLNKRERWLSIFLIKALVIKLIWFPFSKKRTLSASFPSTSTHAEVDYLGVGWTNK